MMNRKEFFEYIKENVKEFLPDAYEKEKFALQETTKNNDATRTGLIMPREGENLTPTIYLDDLYKEYLDGKSLDSCVGDIADRRIECEAEAPVVDVEKLLDYSQVKDKLQVRICDPEWNEERLKGKVFTMHGDFAAYYAVNIFEKEDNLASFVITENIMKSWGITVEQLHQDAIMADKNRGIILNSLEDLIQNMIYGIGEPENLLQSDQVMGELAGGPIPMFCLTNEDKMNGASLILHEDVRKQIGDFMQSDFYILPSSIHETLIIPVNEEFSVNELNQMVDQVNGSEVSLEERLSDKVQFCDGKTAVMENAVKHENHLEAEKKATKEQNSEKKGIHKKLEKAKAEVKQNIGKTNTKAKDHAMSI